MISGSADVISTTRPEEESQLPPIPRRQPLVEDMTTATQTLPQDPYSPAHYPLGRRPTLPPLARIDGLFATSGSIPLVSSPATGPSFPPTPFSTSPRTDRSRYPSDTRTSSLSHHDFPSAQAVPDSMQPRPTGWGSGPYQPYQRLPSHDQSTNPLKRPFGSATQPHDRFNAQPPSQNTSPAYTDPGSSPHSQTYSHLPFSTRSSLSGPAVPSRTHSFASQGSSTTFYQQAPTSHAVHTVQSRPSNLHRLSLHLRQQPRAARAGPDGKDRRAIDPPPVVQLMLTNFDPLSDDDMNEIRSSCFVVHCKLVSPHTPKKDVSTLASQNDDGSIEIQRLLLGTTVSSPFFCADDPDPDNMPEHPKTADTARGDAPPSPTNRFIQIRPPVATTEADKKKSRTKETPGSFFIFPDLSVRKAGEYRLEFSLMKMVDESMQMGGRLPVITKVTSQIFRVVNAKDFDQVQPSTELVKGLLDRGAGFPLKLKKGTRETGSRKKGDGSGNGSDDEEEGESDGEGEGDE